MARNSAHPPSPQPSVATSVPPVYEIFGLRELAARHSRLLPENRLRWMARNRATNGLLSAGAIFESPCGELLFSEPRVIAWVLGLTGREKPRATRSTTRSTPRSTTRRAA